MKKWQLHVWLWGLMFILPSLWLIIDMRGGLDGMHHIGMNLRYKLRGERPAPIKLMYVDLDADAVALFGERPWSRGGFANVASFLFQLGKVRAVGFDFIFSPATPSAMVPPEKIRESDEALALAVQLFPQIVLAADYNNQLQLSHMEQPSVRPDLSRWDELSAEEREHMLRAYPEAPGFPIIGPDWGTLGLISYDPRKSAGPVPRWVPAYAPYRGEARSRQQMESMRMYYGLPTAVIEVDGSDFVLRDENGEELERVPRVTEGNLFHFSIELVRQYYGLPAEALEIEENAIVLRDETQVFHRIPLSEDKMIEVNWFSRWLSDLNPRTSIRDVYYYAELWESDDEAARAEAAAFFARFEDAVVLVGPVDPTLQDLAPTPFDREPVPKVGVHGNLIKTIVSGAYIQHLPYAASIAATYLLTLCVTLPGLIGGRWRFAGLAVLLVYAALAVVMFAQVNLVLPLVTPVAAALSTALLAFLLQLVIEERQKGRIKEMFGTYVAPTLVEQMIESGEEPQLGGVERELTCFFSDVEGFSTFSEQLSPPHLVELMNEYLTAMTDVLQAEGGALDKYIGDAIVAMFGAPLRLEDHALRACRAALLMQERQLQLRKKWAAEDNKWPAIVGNMKTRIGLNCGTVTVGNMGSRSRFNYTMMGDAVNLAARCESAAKQYGVYTLITEAVWNACGKESSGMLAARVDRVAVKGRQQPVDLYELIGFKDQVSPAQLEVIAHQEAGLDAYFSTDFITAISCFEKAIATVDAQRKLSPAHVLKTRCQYYRQHPPVTSTGEAWDGVFRLEVK